MTSNDAEHRESIDRRTRRALEEALTVLDHNETPIDDADTSVVTVTSASGSTYDVDTDAGVCSCEDFRHREPEGGCKHIRRARVELGRDVIDAAMLRALDVDDLLGAFAPGPRVATADGGVVGGGPTPEPSVREAAEDAEIVGVDGYDLERIEGAGVLVFEPRTEYREHLGREVTTGRRLVGVANVVDRLALRDELAKRGLPVAEAHLEEVALPEVRSR